MNIPAVAEAAGLPVKTVRYYSDSGTAVRTAAARFVPAVEEDG